jgi:hypothetical protein
MHHRRTIDRYRPFGSAFVIFESPRLYNFGKPRIIRMGPISDISQQGLSVEYYPHKDHERDFQELSILVPGQGMVVYRIPFQKVSDTVVSDSIKRQPIMRRGMQFGKVDEQHSDQLAAFLEVYTRGIVPDRRSGYERRSDLKADSPFRVIQKEDENAGRRIGKDRRIGDKTTF